MQLKRLYIKEYKLFKDFPYEFPADDKHFVNVLIGINGSGKSTILEAIAEIFSCVVLGEKAKFGFQIVYSFKQNSIDFPPDYRGFFPYPLDILIRSGKDKKPEMLIRIADSEEFQMIPKFSNYREFIPKSIVIYYSGYSQIMRNICIPHNKKLSENLRKRESSSIQFYYHEPELFSVILLSLLAFEYGEVPEFLKQKAKIVGVEKIQIKLKEPYWADSGSIINDFWGATGDVRHFLDFLCPNYTGISGDYKFLDYDIVKSNVYVEELGYNELLININGERTLFVIKEFLEEERALFEVLRTMFIDDLLAEIQITLIKEENGEQKTFSILSEGEQQSITIKGLTELLAGENTLFLFDEPDTFLHPKWQRNFISEIEETIESHRPNELTYLIATHSPQLLSNANPEKTFVKIIEDGQLVEQTPKYYGREISSILYNLMGVEERNEAIRKELSRLFKLIENEEIEEAEKLLKDLTEVLGDTDADIQNAAIQLNYLKEDEAD